MKFYIYSYLNPCKPGVYRYKNINYIFLYEPFYIGKGSGQRIFVHLKEKKPINNKYKFDNIKEIRNQGEEPITIKLGEHDDEKFILNYEKFLIKSIGRKDKGLGPLTNLTDGGDGSCNPSEETRIKIGAKSKTQHRKRGTNKGDYLWINNSNDCIFIKKENLDFYLNNGWFIGRFCKNYLNLFKGKHHTIESNQKNRESQSRRDPLCIEKMVKNRNYTKGIDNPLFGCIVVCSLKQNENKYIRKEELNKYLSNGWLKGTLKTKRR